MDDEPISLPRDDPDYGMHCGNIAEIISCVADAEPGACDPTLGQSPADVAAAAVQVYLRACGVGTPAGVARNDAISPHRID